MGRSLIAYLMTLSLVLALGAVACGEDSSPSPLPDDNDTTNLPDGVMTVGYDVWEIAPT